MTANGRGNANGHFRQIVEDLRAALEEFEAIAADLAPTEDLTPA